MNILELKIDSKIAKDSLEYKSILDSNKPHSIYKITKFGLNATNENRGGQLDNLKSELSNPNARIFHIPINEVKIYHYLSNPNPHENPQNPHENPQNIKVCSYGGIFINDKVISQSLNSATDSTYQQDEFDYISNLSICNIKSKSDIKNLIKKIYFRYISIRSFNNRKIFKDKTKPKIIFFCAWFSNMYHFVFEGYGRLLILLEMARKNNMDFYIIAPPKHRGFSKYHQWFISQILDIENIPKDRILYLDYQNYHIDNVYFCSNPQCNDKYILPAIKKLQDNLYDSNFKAKGERIYISRKKSPRRYLVNEDEIFEILHHKYGFEKIYMEDYNLKEKINHIMRAKVIISIEGTSLINGLFMNATNAKLIGLRSHSMTEHLLIISAMFKNIEYLPIICDIYDNSDENQWAENNLYLNKEYLIKKLKDYEIDEMHK
ncbi:hypothetical protein CCY99_04525 [Helicobacter sp. 16-1353]|uniref:glycosyltransferase family 61 protein n=1 Tax=Helicobacter sp. 16-1353 TaxID=2004996 RepID=UPI000DCDCAF1|nr:glycosyltransferase family 61 protein [Helicobacter sp. 16-1353]RAX54282.1 hypothetical protein CCY99_04525 [Helicobacter sp. 16-1353]